MDQNTNGRKVTDEELLYWKEKARRILSPTPEERAADERQRQKIKRSNLDTPILRKKLLRQEGATKKKMKFFGIGWWHE